MNDAPTDAAPATFWAFASFGFVVGVFVFSALARRSRATALKRIEAIQAEALAIQRESALRGISRLSRWDELAAEYAALERKLWGRFAGSRIG